MNFIFKPTYKVFFPRGHWGHMPFRELDGRVLWQVETSHLFQHAELQTSQKIQLLELT